MNKPIRMNQALAAFCSLTITFAYATTSAAAPATSIQIAWQFNTNSNPAAPELLTGIEPGAQADIHPGKSAGGYLASSAPLLLSGSGFWDLGVSGTITLSKPGGIVGSAAQERLLTVTTVQLYDGTLYVGAANVAVPGATFVGGKETVLPSEPGAFGVRLVEETVWNLPAGDSPESVLVTGLPGSSLIDSITVESQAVMPPPAVELVINVLPGEQRQVEVSWPSSAVGFALQSTASPGDPLSWESVDSEPQLSGDRAKVVIPATDAAQFFRLNQQ